MRFRASVEHARRVERRSFPIRTIRNVPSLREGSWKMRLERTVHISRVATYGRELGRAQRANRWMRFLERDIFFNRSDFLPERAYAAGNARRRRSRKFYPKYTENDCAWFIVRRCGIELNFATGNRYYWSRTSPSPPPPPSPSPFPRATNVGR